MRTDKGYFVHGKRNLHIIIIPSTMKRLVKMCIRVCVLMTSEAPMVSSSTSWSAVITPLVPSLIRTDAHTSSAHEKLSPSTGTCAYYSEYTAFFSEYSKFQNMHKVNVQKGNHVCLHVSSPKFLYGFWLNLVLGHGGGGEFIKSCWTNLILVSNGPI